MLVTDRQPKSVILVSGSPSPSSKTAMVCDYISHLLVQRGAKAQHLKVRDLSPGALLSGDLSDARLKEAIDQITAADGLVLATPTFKASFSGLLKAFIDVLPQYGLRDKVVLPIATGGSLAHVLGLDYGLRPVLQSMRPKSIVPSVFLLEKDLQVQPAFDVKDTSRTFLLEILEEFTSALHGAPAMVPVAEAEEPERPLQTVS